MHLAFYLLPPLPLVFALELPPVPSQITIPASVATYAASVASAKATALSIDNNLGISSGTPGLQLPDPCGPPTQTPGRANSSSTCRKEVSTNHTSKPQVYGVTCLNSTSAPASIAQALDLNACANAMIQICYTLAGLYGEPPTDEWIFTNGTTTTTKGSFGSEGGGNCTAGFWLPSGGAPAPSFLRCVDGIFAPLVKACGGGRKGGGLGGSVNLSVLPGFGVAEDGENQGGVDEVGVEGGTGTAVDDRYPSYFVVA